MMPMARKASLGMRREDMSAITGWAAALLTACGRTHVCVGMDCSLQISFLAHESQESRLQTISLPWRGRWR